MLSPQLRSFLIGIFMALLIGLVPALVLEQPPYEIMDPTGDPSWDFSSTLSLSATLQARSHSLIRFTVESTSIEVDEGSVSAVFPKARFARGSSGVSGLIIPTQNVYNLTEPIGDYDLEVTSLSLLGLGTYTGVFAPEDLGAITAGYTASFPLDNAFEQISVDELENRLYSEFNSDHDLMEIRLHYNDGTSILIFIVNGQVYVIFNVLDLFLFDEWGVCICANDMDSDVREIYVTQLDNIDMVPFEYAVNEIILSLERGGSIAGDA